MASAVEVTKNELLEALANAMPANPGPADAKTSRELAKQHGIPVYKVIAALNLLNEIGQLEVHRVTRPALGRRATVQAYTIKPAKKSRRA